MENNYKAYKQREINRDLRYDVVKFIAMLFVIVLHVNGYAWDTFEEYTVAPIGGGGKRFMAFYRVSYLPSNSFICTCGRTFSY